MTGSSNKGYQIYHSVLGMALTLALLLWINEYFVLKVHLIVCTFYSLAFAGLIYALERNKKSGVNYLALLSLLPIIGLIFLLTKTKPSTWARELIDWVIRYDGSEELYKIMQANTVMVLVAVLASILFYIFIKRFVTRLFLAIFAMVLFIIASVLDIHIGKIIVGIGMFFFVSILTELSGILYSRKSGREDKKESILYLLPVCIILAVIATALPSKSQPIQWTGVKNLYYTVQDSIDRLMIEWDFFVGGGDGIFSISLSGFSEDGSLDNEDLNNSNRIALIVRGRKGLSPIYLTGSVNDVYTGHRWEKSGSDSISDEQEYQMDYGELLYGLSRLDPTVFSENRIVEGKSIQIIYNNIKTKTFFYPSKSRWYKFKNENYELETESASMTFSKSRSDASYEVSYYEMNLHNPAFQEMLRSTDEFSYKDSHYIDYDAIESMKSYIFIRGSEDNIFSRRGAYEVFMKRAELINERYTKLPEDLPIRVKELAYEITKDEETNYDKLKAIEAYLIGLTYTYTPGRVPEGRDFVDYFLFDNKKGYCTSFGTAMAILGRCIDIPTRYVEGFVVNYNDETGKGFMVRDNNAHAWAEAYFEGVGWIPFEATPPFHGERYSPWAPRRTYENYDSSAYLMGRQEEELIEEPQDYSLEIPQNHSKLDKVWIWISVLVAAILLLFFAMLIYYLILQRMYKREMEAADYSKKMYLTFVRILVLLRFEGFRLEPQDTLLMLANRVKDRYTYDGITFHQVVNIYMSYRYGEIATKDVEYDIVRRYYNGLKEEHTNKSKALKLHLEEFSFLIKRKSYNPTNQD